MQRYARAAAAIRTGLPTAPRLTDFVRYATLAANSHNTQPWRFELVESAVTIRPDFSRRTPAVDPDDHHLFVSLGCAAENFLVAAAANGRPGESVFASESPTEVRVDLGRGRATDETLAEAIPKRQSTRSDFDGHKLDPVELSSLEAAATLPGVEVRLIPDRTGIEQVLEFVVAANRSLMENPAFVRELERWIRFSPSAALQTGDGLFTACSGNPVMPEWIGRFFFRRAFRINRENDRYARQLRSSSAVAVFVAERDGSAGWIQAGRSFQRFALQATTLGLRLAHISQPIEIAPVRREFAAWLGSPDRRPNIVVRIGRAPPMPMSMRRPVGDVACSV